MYYVYIIQNILNNKIYVGQSINPNKRWIRHKCNAKAGNKTLPYLYNAMYKYGNHNFTFTVIENFDLLNDVNEAEEFWIQFFQSRKREFGYNLKGGGANGAISDETKKKMSIAKLGKKLSNEHRTNISKSGIGRKTSNEAKQNISNALKGRSQSNETKEKISISKTGNTKANSGSFKKGQVPWNKGKNGQQ